MTTENSIEESGEISIKELINKLIEIFNFLKSKWKIIFLFSFIGASLGLFIAYKEKPTYKAVLTFAMDDEKSGGAINGALGFASTFGLDLSGGSGGSIFSGPNLFELMKSRLLVEKTLLRPVIIKKDTISLAEYFITINEIRKTWENNNRLKNLKFNYNVDRNEFSREQDSILNQFYKILTSEENLVIKQKDKKLTITTIEVINQDEKFAKYFCEMLAKEVSDYYIETKSKKARINSEILKKQVDSVRAELNNSISNVATEVDNNYNLNPALSKKASSSKKRAIDVQANTAILTQLVTQSELAKIALRKETPLIQLIDSPIYPLDMQKRSKLKFLIIGGILGALLVSFYLLLGKIINENLN